MVKMQTQRLGRDSDCLNVWLKEIRQEAIDYKHTAVILCDVWDRHWSSAACLRLERLLGRMDGFVREMRRRGALIIHAPSDTISVYADLPARRRMLEYPRLVPQVVCPVSDPPMPVDASDGGSDSCEKPEEVNHAVWTRQHPAIWIDPENDRISDNGDEIFSCLKAEKITNVFMVGVHTNMCILHRTFGIKNLVRWGLKPVLVRDLTDLMYNPAMPPYVSHEEALSLVVGYIEKFWCPTALSADILTDIESKEELS